MQVKSETKHSKQPLVPQGLGPRDAGLLRPQTPPMDSGPIPPKDSSPLVASGKHKHQKELWRLVFLRFDRPSRLVLKPVLGIKALHEFVRLQADGIKAEVGIRRLASGFGQLFLWWRCNITRRYSSKLKPDRIKSHIYIYMYTNPSATLDPNPLEGSNL